MMFKMFLLVGIVVIDVIAIFVSAEPTAVVCTTSGPVRGEILTSVNSVKYAAFQGIRFGKAPVGYLRFKPPVAPEPWTEVFNATTEGSTCPQIGFGTDEVVGSEDCLFINVFTPVIELDKPPKKLKSVMVWFYGGGYMAGTPTATLYHPDFLLEKDVVYVSMNFRLGALGFLAMGHPNATGNAGLKDQTLALEWVKSNIKNFGGNPCNVTIFGESSGGMSASSHVISERSAGLFHGVISMSSTAISPAAFMTPEKALASAIRLASLLGTNSTDKNILLQTFYDASVEQLVKIGVGMKIFFPAFGPTVEDKRIAADPFLTTCSIVKYLTGNFIKVPQMLGYLDQEGVFFFDTLKTIAEFFLNDNDVIANEFGMELPQSLIDEIRLLVRDWPAHQTSSNFLGSAVQRMSEILTDLIFTTQIDQTQSLLAAYNGDNPVYYYHFSFYTNRSLHNLLNNNTVPGAGHADDIAWIFYWPPANYSSNPSDPVARTIERVTTMWTNFAKYSNPTPDWLPNPLNVIWPNSGLDGLSLNIGYDLVVGPRPTNNFTKSLQLWTWPLLAGANGCLPEKRSHRNHHNYWNYRDH